MSADLHFSPEMTIREFVEANHADAHEDPEAMLEELTWSDLAVFSQDAATNAIMTHESDNEETRRETMLFLAASMLFAREALLAFRVNPKETVA